MLPHMCMFFMHVLQIKVKYTHEKIMRLYESVYGIKSKTFYRKH